MEKNIWVSRVYTAWQETSKRKKMALIALPILLITLFVFVSRNKKEEMPVRNTEVECNTIYKMIEYPMFISRDYVEEVDIKNLKNINMDIFDDRDCQQNVMNLDEKRVQDAKQRLMMQQIEKTTVTVGNTIDKFIKFN